MSYITSLFFRSMCLNIKARIFKKRIYKFRRTNNITLITEKDFNTFGVLLFASLLSCGFIFAFFIFFVMVAAGAYYFVRLLFKEPNNTTGIIALIVGILSIFGVVYSANKKRKDETKDKFDKSIYIILQFLIEAKRKNFNYKIYKEDLSYIFMNVPNVILFILGDIQSNIQKIKNSDEENEKHILNNVVDKEILFLITYIREYYHITDSDLKKDVEHESIINDLIDYNNHAKPQQTEK